MSMHSSLLIARAVLAAGGRRTTRRASGGFAQGALIGTAIGSPVVAYILGRRAAETLASFVAHSPEGLLVAGVAMACASAIGVMFSAWRMEPESLGLHILAAPIGKPALFAGLVALPLASLALTVILPLAAAGALGWSAVGSLPDLAAISLGAWALAAGFLSGALVAEAAIGVARGSGRPMFGAGVGAVAWLACGVGGDNVAAGPVNVLAGGVVDVDIASAAALALGFGGLVAAWMWSATSRPSRKGRRARGMLRVSCRGPLTATSSATLAIVLADAHVRRALGLGAVLSAGVGIATLATGAPDELAVLSASTIITFGVMSVVLIATQVSDAAPWLWRTAPIGTWARLSVTLAAAAIAALVVCIFATVTVALAMGATPSVILQLMPQFTAAIASCVVVGVVAPRRPGRLLGDLVQLAAVAIVSVLALKAAGLVGDGPTAQSVMLAVGLAGSVAGAARWRAAREEFAT